MYQINVSDNIVSGQHSLSCNWSGRADWFSPALSWENCGGNSDWSKGVGKIRSESGQLWPLKVGNKAVYEYSSKSLTNGQEGSSVRTCKVESIVQINVTVGKKDAYKVVCIDDHGGSTAERRWYCEVAPLSWTT